MLIVVPSRRAAARIADAALERSAPAGGLASRALWTDRILTLRDLVEAAAAAAPDPRPWLPRAAAAVLADEVVERLEAPVRALFGPGVVGPGAARAIGSALAEIRMAGLSAAQVAEAATGRRRLQALAAALDLWERRLAEGGWWDDAAAHRAAIAAIEAGAWPDPAADRLEVRGLYDVTPLQGELLVALARRAAVVRVHVPFDPVDEEATRFAFPYVHRWETLTDPGLDVELVYPDGGGAARVEFAAGADRADEVRRLAAWLRERAEAGEPLEEIGVVVPDTARALPHLGRELDRRGVPWHARRGSALAETPAFAAALLPFRLLEDGFRRADLAAWATSPLTTRLDAAALRPLLAEGPAGRTRPARWRRALRGPAATPMLKAIERVEVAGAAPLAPADFWAEWSTALAAAGLDPGEPWEEALATLREALQSIGRWDGPPGAWRAHRRQLLGVIGERRARVGRPGRGVRVHTPYDARGLAFRHLAVIGLASGALVPRSAALPVFGERERRALGARYGPELFRLPAEAAAESALLLHDWIRATDGVVRLSFPGREDDGTPLLPALEFERLRRARGAAAPDTAVPAPVPAWRLGVSADRVAALQRLEADRADWFARTVDDRRGRGGRFDGAFEPDARAALAAEVDGGALADWSGGRLETFRQCPHQFFQRCVLGLRPPQESRLEAEARAIGSAVHAALRILHEEGSAARPDRDRIEAALEAAGGEVPRVERGDPDVWRTLVARAAAYLNRYFERLPDEPHAPLPAAFEAGFGLDPGDAAGVPIRTTLGEVRLRGRIDRLDRDPATGALRVIDYKYSEAFRQKEAVDPARCGVDRFQLWSYYLGARAWAEKEEWDEPAEVRGEIHCLRERRSKAVLVAEPSPPPADVAARIAAAIEAAAAGEFDPSPADAKRCAWCDFRRSCRIATVALGPAAAPLEDEE